MNGLVEFFIPNHVSDLEDVSNASKGRYCVDTVCDFDIPLHQQLDDLTRLFDSLQREKSPTALFTKPELFFPLYSYIKTVVNESRSVDVTKAARHKICHEISERMKKLLQVSLAFLKRRKETNSTNEALEVCLRSTLKMYTFLICNILLSTAPIVDAEEGGTASSSQRAGRKRGRRDAEAGFGDDDSGVDLDGRELALTSLIELSTSDILALWPQQRLENELLNLVLKMSLHMITQKANIGNDAQSVSGALALLLARVSSCLLSNQSSLDPSDLVSPMVELALKSEAAALFLSKFVADIELEESSGELSERILHALLENMAHAALYEIGGDSSAAKNVALFFGEVAKKSVSVTVKMSDLILPIIQSENHDVRKAVVTCIAEMVLQRYTGHARNAVDDQIRDKYLNELLYRVLDINPFVRNYTLHVWERLVDAKAVPKRYQLALTASMVGRLEDKNYLVRDAAMTVISCILKKNWFGHVLDSKLIREKKDEATRGAAATFPDAALLEDGLKWMRAQYFPVEKSNEDPLDENAEETGVENCREPELSEEQLTSVNKILFFESTLTFTESAQTALNYACILLDSKTERDVIEAIKLIVTCSGCRLEGCERAFLKVLVMVFDGELKIQLAVRDAFTEVIFMAFNRLSNSAVTRTTASVQKLIRVLADATEGEISAMERVFHLMKLTPAYSRFISGQFIEAAWGIAEGSVDLEATADDRRTAMRIYSLLSRFNWNDLRTRKESILEFLESDASKDNVLISYVFNALQNEALISHFRPIPSSVNPNSHPVLKHLVVHLCRRTTAIASWLRLAEAAINAIHHLCEVPVVIYNYVLEYLGHVAETTDDTNTKSQLFFVVGRTALKQLVAVESTERQQLKAVDDPSSPTEENPNGSPDSMHRELGLGSHEFRRHAIQELTQRRKEAIVSEGSIWSRFANDVVATCCLKARECEQRPFERICAVMALCQLMIVSEDFCAQHLPLLLSIVSDKHEGWVVKTNSVIALGDLACVHPNLLAPYLSVPTTGFFKLLTDDDLRVRAVTIQVCSHLVLGEMLRIRDHLYTVIKLVADPDEAIANNAVIFVQNLALKEKEKTGNLIPPLVTQLSGIMPSDKFQLAMRTLLERVEGDRPTESLIERLCQRFEAFSERSKKKLQLAQNIAFCLHELNYSTERSIKRLMSEACYQQYKHWLRNNEVFDYFKSIAVKAKKAGRGNSDRRDKAAIEEWEARMKVDACGQRGNEETAEADEMNPEP